MFQSLSPEIVLHDFSDGVQEAEDHGDVGVGPGRGHDVQVGVTDKGESTFWQLY